MIKYNAVISTDAQGKIEIVVNEDNESFDFEAESTIYLGACFSDYELNELLEKNFAHIKRIKEELSLIHISEPTRLGMISYAVFCLKKKKKKRKREAKKQSIEENQRK